MFIVAEIVQFSTAIAATILMFQCTVLAIRLAVDWWKGENGITAGLMMLNGGLMAASLTAMARNMIEGAARLNEAINFYQARPVGVLQISFDALTFLAIVLAGIGNHIIYTRSRHGIGTVQESSNEGAD